MDWRVFLTTFGVIFLAEMGDKTQLAAMTMAAQSKKPWPYSLPPPWRSRRFQRLVCWPEACSAITFHSCGSSALPQSHSSHWNIDSRRQVLRRARQTSLGAFAELSDLLRNTWFVLQGTGKEHETAKNRNRSTTSGYWFSLVRASVAHKSSAQHRRRRRHTIRNLEP